MLDFAFELAASNLRYGPGVTREIGMDIAELGLRRVMVLTDPTLVSLPPVATVRESLERDRIEYDLFDQVRVEPSGQSFKTAIEAAEAGEYDAFVAVGGGSTIDTAKAANLYATYPAPFMTYVNAPIGDGQPVPGPLKPLFAVPTTSGTGSETTGVSIFDDAGHRAKTGIAHRRLKPTLGFVDPENTRTLPPVVIASTGLDVMCHALESYTAMPYTRRPYPERPILRPAYQGSNPISDIWACQSLKMVAKFLPRFFRDSDDEEARGQMILASAFAGIGFGNAGVHLCHGMSYPVSSMVRDFQPSGYPTDHPLVPHGMSVVLPAPAVFRFTAPACPDRHLHGAAILGAKTDHCSIEDAGRVLSERIIHFMQELEVPNGLSALGYTEADVSALVKGTLPQHRVTKLSPRSAEADDLAAMFTESLTIW